jgi:hypothetical protein
MLLKKDNWGNQELPGISNEELLSEEFARRIQAAENSEASKIRFSDPQFKAHWKKQLDKKFKKLRADPEWVNDWYKKNSERLEDPEYLKKLSESLKNSDAVKIAAKKKGADPDFRKAVSKGILRYTNSPDYVNPRGMLGKKASEETKKKQSNALTGLVKPLEGNKKISEARKGKSPKQESIEKMREKLLGKETGRSRQVQTPVGVFDKLKDAADYYGVATGSIKNFIKGQNVKEWFKPQLELKGVMFEGLKPLGFAWLGDMKSELGAKKIKTPDGIFANVTEAGKFYNVGPATIRHRIKAQPEKYSYIKD